MTGPINPEEFTVAVRELRAKGPQQRVVDSLTPLRGALAELRREGRTYGEIWTALKKAGLDCCYGSAVRAIKEVLGGPVRPLAEARARTRARRDAGRSLPVVPRALASAAAASVKPTASGDPYQLAETRRLAAGLKDAFPKAKKSP